MSGHVSTGRQRWYFRKKRGERQDRRAKPCCTRNDRRSRRTSLVSVTLYNARPEPVEGRAVFRARGSTGSPRACPGTSASGLCKQQFLHETAAASPGCPAPAVNIRKPACWMPPASSRWSTTTAASDAGSCGTAPRAATGVSPWRRWPIRGERRKRKSPH